MREIKPTNKSVPSNDINDLVFNSGKVDEVATSNLHTYTDRMGIQRYTIEGLNHLAKQAMSNYGYVTKKSFEMGNTLTAANDVLLFESEGEYYRWGGNFPKDVPAGSTPESAGGIGADKWTSVGDASFRYDLKTGDGSLIGVGNGETLKERLDKLHTSITPEMFILSGEVIHNRAFEEMYAYAKEKGVKVEGVGQYVLEATEGGIDITVDTDLSKASILCKTKENVGQWQQRKRIFSVNQEYEDISHHFFNVDIVKNAQQFSVKGLSGHITIKSEDIVMNRIDGNEVEAQLKAETNQIFPSGKLKYPQYYNFSINRQVLYKPHLGAMDIKLGAVLLDNAFIRSVITCKRNNVSLELSSVATKNNGHCQAYVEQVDCSCFSFNDTNYYLDDSTTGNLGGYALTYKYTTETRLNHITNVNGWAGTDGNYARDIKANDCDLLTIGGHFSLADISIVSCTIRNHCRAQGWGVFEILNSKHILHDGEARQMTLGTRYDYGNSWDGIMRVDNLVVLLGDYTKQYSIVSAQEPKENHRFIGVCPDIYVSNINIVTQRVKDATGMEIRGIDLGVSKNQGYEKYQYLPRAHSISKVTFGDTFWFNRVDFRPVYNNRNYSQITASELSEIRRQNHTYTVFVDELILEKAGKSDNGGYFGVMTFDFPAHATTTQYINISKSNNCIPVLRADTSIVATIDNQQNNFCAVDARRDKDKLSFNEIHINNSVIYEPQIYNSTSVGRPCLVYFSTCKFDWLEFSPFSTSLPVSDFKVGLGSNLVNTAGPLTVFMTGCYSRIEGEGRTLNATFKEWITKNYRRQGYVV